LQIRPKYQEYAFLTALYLSKICFLSQCKTFTATFSGMKSMRAVCGIIVLIGGMISPHLVFADSHTPQTGQQSRVLAQNNVVLGQNPTTTVFTPRPVNSPYQADWSSYSQASTANVPAGQGSCYDYVPQYASKYGVSEDLMNAIITAESKGNPYAKNRSSSASGCAQFIRSTWAGTLAQMGKPYVSPFNAEANVEALAWKIANGGVGAWNSSRSAWSK
jgi:hypothetical protein